MNEIVVISGKGGTGKTSIVASLAHLASNSVLADCDVDAADLYLILTPEIKQRFDFYGGNRYEIQQDICSQCLSCVEVCEFSAVEETEVENGLKVKIDQIKCEGCGVCAYFCPEDAISSERNKSGELFIADTRYGSMVYAKLGIAEENSGKLVAFVREHAKKTSAENNADCIIVDGSPGIGCPVISSITGADIVMIVTEPTVSGLSDMKRVSQLARHFKIPATLCINKWDINPEISNEIVKHCREHNITFLGKISYDVSFTEAQVAGKNIYEIDNEKLQDEIRTIWNNLRREVEKSCPQEQIK
ncbi:MAG: (4Fe-4S)-binding protein [candidate division Zixibacteria bacterium]|nr:(4Fe-4S)-binding protein [candidate division Zixibacteria bacterium]